MRIVVGSDESTELTDSIIHELEQRGHKVAAVGPPAGQPLQWVDVAHEVAHRVAGGQADEGVLCCWTGTGCTDFCVTGLCVVTAGVGVALSCGVEICEFTAGEEATVGGGTAARLFTGVI